MAWAEYSKAYEDDFHMHVNVSVTQLKQANFAQVVLDTLEQTQFPARQLTLEITESQILESHPDVTENLKQIYKAVSISLSMTLARDTHRWRTCTSYHSVPSK